MKAVILTEGGKNIGLGHLARCLALVQGIRQAVPRPEIDFIVNEDRGVKDFLKGQKVRPVILNWIEEVEKLSSSLKKADLVIIDSYIAPRSFYSFVYDSKPSLNQCVVAIDDYNRMNYPADIVINPSIYGDKINYGADIAQEPMYLLGRDYIILRKEFWRVPQKTIRSEIKDILLTFGGGGQTGFINGLLKFFATNYPHLTLHIISSSSQDLYPGANSRQYRLLSGLDTRNLMLRCDLCVSAGGQALNELGRIGLPAIGICFAENQRLNLEGWSKEEFIEYIGWFSERNLLDKLNASISKLISKEARLNKSKAGRSLVDGQGVRRLIKCILAR